MGKRVFGGVLVYNGREFTPDCIRSAGRLNKSGHDVDLAVLDDCSPDPGWSAELKGLARSAGLEYYRSPRNLGIPRNMNLALSYGLKHGYDYILLLNSDLVMPDNFLDAMVDVAASDPSIGSVTAWSNKASIYSLPHADGRSGIDQQANVDWISRVLQGAFAGRSLHIPVAVGFCMLLSAAAVREVGLMDPVFGRGYCEELDWSLRAASLGKRNALATSVFVYHLGTGSSREAGILGADESSVDSNEALVDYRFPNFRSQVAQFEATGVLESMKKEAVKQIVRTAAREWGFRVEATTQRQSTGAGDEVLFTVDPDDEKLRLETEYLGFRFEVAPAELGVVATLKELIGRPPAQVTVSARGPGADRLALDARSKELEVVYALAEPSAPGTTDHSGAS